MDYKALYMLTDSANVPSEQYERGFIRLSEMMTEEETSVLVARIETLPKVLDNVS